MIILLAFLAFPLFCYYCGIATLFIDNHHRPKTFRTKKEFLMALIPFFWWVKQLVKNFEDLK